MLDYKYVIDHLDEVITRLETRTGDYSYLKELPSLGSATARYKDISSLVEIL